MQIINEENLHMKNESLESWFSLAHFSPSFLKNKRMLRKKIKAGDQEEWGKTSPFG